MLGLRRCHYSTKTLLGSPPFWIALLLLFAIHLVVSIFVALQISRLRAAWVGIAFVVETVVCSGLLQVVVSWDSASKPFRTRH